MLLAVVLLSYARLLRRFCPRASCLMLAIDTDQRAAERLATRQGAFVADGQVEKRPKVRPGRPVLTPCQMIPRHDHGARPHVAKRMVPYVQRPPARNDSPLDVHGEGVEPAERSIDQVEVRRAIVRYTPGPGNLNNQPAPAVQLLRRQDLICRAVRLALLLPLLDKNGDQRQHHRCRRDHDAEKILEPSHARESYSAMVDERGQTRVDRLCQGRPVSASAASTPTRRRSRSGP